MFLRVLDIAGALSIIFALLLCSKSYKVWLIYSMGCLCYLILHLSIKVYGASILEFVTCIIGIKNYVAFKKEYEKKKSFDNQIWN